MDKFLGAVAIIILAIIWAALWTGLGLSVLWNWFVAPKFLLPQLGILEAYGLALVAACVRTRGNVDAKRFAEWFVFAPFSTGVVLLTGWVVTLWI